MTRDEAKRILLLYRPDSVEPPDPEMEGALNLLKRDAELREWFEAHCATQSAIRNALRTISPPAALKEQILSERPKAAATPAWRRPSNVLLIASLLALLIVSGVWWQRQSGVTEELSYDAYRGRMVRTALRLYGMELETNSTPVIRAYLGQQHARADFALPSGLAEASPTGCGVLSWQGNSVSMVCFHSGRTLKPGEKTDLFLFVMKSDAAIGAPDQPAPKFAEENRMLTASWREGDLVYLLATEGDEEFLRKFL